MSRFLGLCIRFCVQKCQRNHDLDPDLVLDPVHINDIKRNIQDPRLKSLKSSPSQDTNLNRDHPLSATVNLSQDLYQDLDLDPGPYPAMKEVPLILTIIQGEDLVQLKAISRVWETVQISRETKIILKLLRV